jgi:hypothetical protein
VRRLRQVGLDGVAPAGTVVSSTSSSYYDALGPDDNGLHVGLITAVSGGNVTIVNGDFGNPSDDGYIMVVSDSATDSPSGLESWGGGAEGESIDYVLVPPNLSAPSTHSGSATADSAWDNLFQSYGDTSGGWNGGDGATPVP